MEGSAIERVERPSKKNGLRMANAQKHWSLSTLIFGIGTQVAKGGESGYEDPPSFQATGTVSFLGAVVNFKVRSLHGSFDDFQEDVC